MHEKEIKQIQAQLDPELYQLLRESRAVLAGGALTSIFTNKEVNDWDIYFQTKEGFFNFVRGIYRLNSSDYASLSTARVNHMTDRSILCVDGNQNNIQLIGFKTFNSPWNIFDSFDFTINMAAFDFQTETLTLHKDFLKHNSQRFLQVNEKTDFPLISVLRVDKYRERGYTISKAQMFRLLLAVNKKQFNSWEDFKKELGGLYGLNPDQIVDETKPFSEEEAIRQLDQVFVSTKYVNIDCMPAFSDIYKRFEHMIDEETKEWYDGVKKSGKRIDFLYWDDKAKFDDSKFSLN